MKSTVGEPLILLPGLLGTIESHWRRFIPEFAKQFHTITVDLRGHGRTNNPSGRLRLQTLVDDLHCLCDTLQIGRPYICGYSLGGYIGLAYGLQHPGKVRALVMHGTKFYWSNETISAMVKDLNAETIMQKIPAWGETLQKDHAPANGTAGWRALLAAGRELVELMEKDGLPESALSLVEFPVLISLADADEMIPLQDAKRLVNALPRSTLSTMENSKHAMQSVPTKPFIEHTVSFFGSSHFVKDASQSTRKE